MGYPLEHQDETQRLEKQIQILLKLGRLDYDKIISISQSDKIEELAKNAFLNSAFENASEEYQYRMLFEDNLIGSIWDLNGLLRGEKAAF